MSGQPVMEMEEVTVGEPAARIAVTDVDWTVRQGEHWVIGGLPGSGKSQLLATAASLIPPRRGRHRLFGLDTSALSEDQLISVRLRMGFVFTFGGRLFSELTVAENLALPIRYHRNCTESEAAEPVEALLALTQLREVAALAPDELPRNLRARVGLARALALSPELLLLDNPLAGLDARQMRWWRDFLRRLATDGLEGGRSPMTLVMASDDLRPWRNQDWRFALLYDRRLQFLGGREELTANRNPVVRDLMGWDSLST